MGTVTSELSFIPYWVAWPLLVSVIVASVGLAVWQFALQPGPDPPAQNRRNRQRLLEKVQVSWIHGVLEKSIFSAAPILLRLHEQPAAVENPWEPNAAPLDQLERPLPPTQITQAFDNAGGELLILGEPGSGKTMLLLALTRDLLVRAGQQEDFPLPVVFNLSSWAAKRQPFEVWLVEELRAKYQVPPALAQSWVDADQILPLLDGLDEVVSSSRTACVKAMNEYRGKHGLVPMVVCCRATEYYTLDMRLLLHTAVVVQPLNAKQIDDCLASAGGKFAAIHVALRDDQELQKLVETPLMLSILPLAYEGISVDSLLKTGPTEERRQQVFKQYILRMLERKKSTYYQPDQTLRRLIWLAHQLEKHKQTEFYLEYMQVDWLSTRWSQNLHHFLTLGPIGALIGLFLGLLIGGLVINDNGLIAYGLIGLCTGLLLSGGVGKKQSRESIPWSWHSLMKKKQLRNALGIGFFIGLAIGSINDYLNQFSLDEIAVDALVVGLIGALIGVLSRILINKITTEIEPAERVSWSRQSFLKTNLLRKGLDVGLVIGLANLLIYGSLFLFGVPFDLLSLLSHVSTRILLSALFSMLLIGLLTSFSSKMDKRIRVKPNEGIWRSARNGVMVGVIVGLLFGLVSVLCFELVSGVFGGRWDAGLADAMFFGRLYSLTCVLLSSLLFGGEACIRHTVLRMFLWLTHSIPWNYAGFLDYAADCILLRKVGGGYIFAHRLLLDCFASLDATLTLKELAKQAQRASPTP